MIRMSLCALALAATSASAAAKEKTTGGWSNVAVSSENTQILLDALTGGANSYGDDVRHTRVCFNSVQSVDQQVVAGMNYRFHVKGCPVSNAKLAGECGANADSGTKCTPVEYVVQVFKQSWSNTLQVTEITDEAGKPVGATLAADSDVVASVKAAAETESEAQATTMTSEEKAQVDAWIKKNHLNQYGDFSDTYYTGGTPLFDESTGTSRDLYDYILSKHPDRPWKDSEMQALRTHLEAAAQDAATQTTAGAVGGRAHDLMSVVVSVGVLTVLIALVAGVKAKRARHRFTYDSLRNREY